MRVVDMLLLIAGAVCLLLAAMNAAVTRVNLTALGLFFWILVPLIAAIQAVA